MLNIKYISNILRPHPVDPFFFSLIKHRLIQRFNLTALMIIIITIIIGDNLVVVVERYFRIFFDNRSYSIFFRLNMIGTCCIFIYRKNDFSLFTYSDLSYTYATVNIWGNRKKNEYCFFPKNCQPRRK